MDAVTRLLSDLVAIPSVNPMGRDVSGPEFLEGRVSDYLVDYFRSIGVGSIAQAFVAGRGWYSLQCGVWTIGFGCWALTGFNILVLFILIALSGLFGAFAKPSPFGEKPKPDPSLDDGF